MKHKTMIAMTVGAILAAALPVAWADGQQPQTPTDQNNPPQQQTPVSGAVSGQAGGQAGVSGQTSTSGQAGAGTQTTTGGNSGGNAQPSGSGSGGSSDAARTQI